MLISSLQKNLILNGLFSSGNNLHFLGVISVYDGKSLIWNTANLLKFYIHIVYSIIL